MDLQNVDLNDLFEALAQGIVRAVCDCGLGDFDVFTVLDALREDD
ncbi:MAG: hypothetical protein Q4B45_08275 [Coriobacteriia bacterium]|nr:hypothetical protein [Coriobacteriia bacterium]